MKKNVWIFNHYATNMFSDKAGRHYWLAENLKQSGYNPIIFCANTDHFNENEIDTHDKLFITKEINKIPFVFVKTSSYKGNGRDRLKNMINFAMNLNKSAKDFVEKFGSPDVILASSVHPFTLIAGINIAKKLNISCITEIRDLWPEVLFLGNKVKENGIVGRLLLAGEKWIYKKSDAIIFLKEGDHEYLHERQWLLSQGGPVDINKCHYINNGIKLATYHEQIKENTIDDKDLDREVFNVVYTGSIRPVNNIGMLLDAAKLIKGHEDIQFLIYGTGNEIEKLELRIKEEKIDNVKLKGRVNKQFIPFILNKSSLNILHYAQNQYNWTRGNSSNKLFEYMASGKPIISTVKMGYSPVDKYDCGITLEYNSAEYLSQSILEFYRMSQERYELYCANAIHAAHEYDYSNHSKKLISIIESI